ncbi:alpha/beta fold hydrolase [Paraburkholderia phenoliruptrix]|uniref:Alpha/beta hydrolase fold protein n=2 Tax=Paraburkholderia phenoliruptrix TaxID=252970 RepID=K0DSN9_9BURK|nr:alpha/beta hydrolase [Paraburkholderia phenoliruptrix]AFT87975.1 alpha/beta hydrolase fold protein [Paraburkholderia phenoliruptrix BR3459a]MDR6418215.1 pimeloyl-ACP methyl ester carboxylesterase [Paraburkholderia phenoliruptrix]CAB4046884.1 Putative aminoacrylate hydrolase RutD [Paraburkholderia phenoliruptrix]
MNARTDFSLLAVPDLSFATIASGICVPYVECGEGEPLVFVHGSLCDYRYWSAQTAALSAHFRCISVSLSHYWPAGEACIQGEFGWQTHVAELAEFIEALGVAPVHLVGHSRGGCVAFHVAREHPRLVKTLTLADPGGPLQLDGMPEAALPAATNALRARVAELIDAGEIDAGLELFVDSVSAPGSWRKSSVAFRTMAADNAATLPKQFRDPLPAYSREAARGVKCRTLLIEGQRSPRMFRNNVEKLAEWIDYSDRQTIAGASHGMNVSNAGAFNRLVQSFVSF